MTKTIYSDLKEKTVVITGGANGIGEAMVHAFHAQGCRVQFCDLDTDKGQQLAEALPEAVFAEVNLKNPVQIEQWIGSIDQVDVLINNAAYDPRIPLAEMTTEAWDDLVGLNLRSFMLTIRESLPKFSAPASVINFSSVTFHLGPPDMAAYVATKGGIIAMSRSLARELGPKGIRVNTISPGWIMTERQLEEHVDEETKAKICEQQCQPVLIQPEEIASVALFLASSSSSAMTGQELLADRGWFYS